MRTATTSIAILTGYLADLVFGDPRRRHPTALFGRTASALESVTYRDQRGAGVAHVAVLLATVVAAAHAQRRSPLALAAATWVCLGGTSLARTGQAMATLLDNGEVETARNLLPSLCGRDPSTLDTAALARAALESVAENTSDAAVAPLIWASVGGIRAICAHRAVNTLDAMIGYRSARYDRFGWAAARSDDIANYAGARITAILVILCAPLVGGSPGAAIRAWRHDAKAHPSPNAGVVESAFAGALGVQLGGFTPYPHGGEHRPTLGSGRPPGATDLLRAVQLSRVVQTAAALLAAAVAGWRLSVMVR